MDPDVLLEMVLHPCDVIVGHRFAIQLREDCPTFVIASGPSQAKPQGPCIGLLLRVELNGLTQASQCRVPFLVPGMA